MKQTPWIQAVTLPVSDQALKQAVRIEPVPVSSIDEIPIELAVEILQAALKVPYRASDQHVQIIRQIMGPVTAHAVLHYGSEEQFIRAAMGQISLAPDPRITVLTGQPGVGKTALLLAIARLVIGRDKIYLCAELPPFPIKPIIHLPIRSNIGKAEMYTLAAREIGLDHEYEARSDANLRHLQLRMIQHGSCGILTDELQFVTRSSNANSQVSVLITRLADLGLPLTLTMNFSLVHKLKKRPPEERARVLSSPIVMLPDDGDDPDYRAYLGDLKVVMDGRLEIDPFKDSYELVQLTGGLKRPLIRLLSVAYKVARREWNRQSERIVVHMDHLRRAYASLEYEEDRKLVEQCHRALLGLSNVPDEYVCPFELPLQQAQVMKERADKLRQQQLAKSELAAALGKSAAQINPTTVASPSNSQAVIQLPSSESPAPPPKSPKRRTSLRTAGDLLAGLTKQA